MIGLVLIVAFTIVFVGCEQKYNGVENPSLKVFEKTCKGKVTDNLTMLKDISLGSLTVYIFIVLLFFEFKNKRYY